MRMAQLFKEVKSLWPEDILTADCVLSDDKVRLHCEWLIELFWSIEDKCAHGEWRRLMNLGISCGIDSYIRTLQPPYPKTISIDCMDLERAVESVNESINDPDSGYYAERNKYENDLDSLLKDQVIELDS